MSDINSQEVLDATVYGRSRARGWATAAAVAGAHVKDLEIQDRYGVKYQRYWLEEATGRIFCLVEAPDKEAAVRVHREAHGLLPDHIHEVVEGS